MIQPRLMAAGCDKDLRPTPQAFFDELNQEFGFTLDVAASPDNAKCDAYFTLEDDGLFQPWSGVCWCNPPYSETHAWVAKADAESLHGVTTVMLIPAATDTKWFHEFVNKKHEIRFVKGRLKFEGQKDPAPFASLVVVFRPPSEQSEGKRPGVSGSEATGETNNKVNPTSEGAA